MTKYVVSYVDIYGDSDCKPHTFRKLYDSYDDAMKALLEDVKEGFNDLSVFDENKLVATISENDHIVWNINEVEVSI